ncbi:Gfo/Idh/MocA family oxidoreductase [Rhizobium ruizarguesonis]|uniref:Gfo/Idh/MocA family protein n=1 Tax=Rhizobium ruizarguesonis TaxID=2081791 RepID=UPI00102FB04A|nr:Gfo/Idh/MocA family oxidoreductase [Rhizobium ruizarguesonis]TAW87714.1 Gfo/Idh/MocA family oxidoreductase [Rhizobium ruizarguesonis]
MITALIGLGRMGMRHASVLEQCHLPITAISDINRDACDTAGNNYGIPEERRFTSAIELIDKIRPELLIVATTAPGHCELVVRAARNGAKMILCEKPMATNLRDCETMISACNSTGVKLAINHQMRFMEQYTIPKSLIESEAFGGLGSVIVSAGNFGMAMNGTHYFEMFRYLCGEDSVKVSAWFSKDELANPRGPQFRDASGSLRLETSSGKRFYMDCSHDQGHGMNVTYNCRNGRISVDELAGNLSFVVRKGEHRGESTTRYGMPYETGSKTITPADAVAPTRSVLEALLKGSDFPTGEHGLLAMKLLVTAHLSHERGGATIDLREEPISPDYTLPIA